VKGLTKEAADAIRHAPRRRRQAARELRARLAGVTDPAALASIRYGARRLRQRKTTTVAPTRPAKNERALERLVQKTRSSIRRGDR
jgi:hypothetical protein